MKVRCKLRFIRLQMKYLTSCDFLIPTQVELDKTMEKQVLIVPVTACEGVEALVKRRRVEVEALEDEVEKLEDALKETK